MNLPTCGGCARRREAIREFMRKLQRDRKEAERARLERAREQK